MRRNSLALLVSVIALLSAAPAIAGTTASTTIPLQTGQSVQNLVNSSRPLTGNAVLQAESVGDSAAAALDVAAVLPVKEQAWDDVLGRYVSPPDEIGLARFDYGRLKASASDYKILVDYIDHLETQDPETLSDAEAVSYWANLYNAVTVKLIVDNYPVKSIRKIKSGPISIGPWGKKLIIVNGERLSLDNVEHDIMRKRYPSPLVHYMVNCASIGCPNLKDSVWRAETLDADRDAAARAFINSPRGVEFSENGLAVSSIYKWFKVDFGGNKDGVLAHIREYADEDLATAIDAGAKIKDYNYDWALNGGSNNE